MTTNKSPTKFGWCMTGQHSMCPAMFDYNPNALICSCECHTGKGKNNDGKKDTGTTKGKNNR